MSPNQPQEWLIIAQARGKDAELIHKNCPDSIGSIYMAGYAIECSLKALLQKKGISFPTSGAEGHNLQALWKQCNLQVRDLADKAGEKTFYIRHWSTDLRYEEKLPIATGLTFSELIDAAKQLSSWLETQVKRSSSRRRR